MRSLPICSVLVCISLHSFGQEVSIPADYSGKWIYTNDNLSDEWYGERFYNMDADELQRYHTTTRKLVDYLHMQPVAQNPRGVTLNVRSRAMYNHYDHEAFPVKHTERVKAEVFIPFCSLTQTAGHVSFSCDEVPFIDVITNDESQVFEPAMNVEILDDKKALKQYLDLFYLPRKLLDLGSGVYLYDWYYKNRVVIARGDRPVWLPVSNREYINRMLVYYTAALKEGRFSQTAMDALNTEISLIPPEMMDQPAYVSSSAEWVLTGICRSSGESALAIYKINPDYFDNTLSRTHVQLITIAIEGHADDADYGGIGSHRVWEFVQGLKGKDLVSLLDVQ